MLAIPPLLSAALLVPALRALPPASDHGDTPLLNAIARPDAKITDLYAFVRGRDLVLAVCLNPAIPNSLTSYAWPSDVTVRIHVDHRSRVRFDDPADLATYGGTIDRPERVRSLARIVVTADTAGIAHLSADGIDLGTQSPNVQFFAGLRDDPFIRGPRIGRNVAAIVVQFPVDEIVGRHRSLLVWATSSIEGRPEPFQDLAGRSLRSMFVENDFMNTSVPADHFRLHGAVPDVLIYDPERPAVFPNGRELEDDVVDLVGHAGTLANDAPFPSMNDVPFLPGFPYLAPPQP